MREGMRGANLALYRRRYDDGFPMMKFQVAFTRLREIREFINREPVLLMQCARLPSVPSGNNRLDLRIVADGIRAQA